MTDTTKGSRRAFARFLGVNESAVRKAIAIGRIDVEPDGSIDFAKAHGQWHSRTDPARRRTPAPQVRSSDRHEVRDDNVHCLLDDFLDRLDHWREIHLENGPAEDISFEEATSGHVTPDMMLRRLRAGMPYVREGDWETGKGFVLRSAWEFDWQLVMLVLTGFYDRLGDRRALGIEG
jgi:hypothetical protein